ncbi:DsbA family protein [Paenibacillus assamensis]|uniref:DsbA family protein n=1 Tax=Paenibacillus assamensis TaxID=311244 RepID=UPI0003FAC872|nr:thioredoxin domain-containing protein [Paenibacillus assamensis]
MSKQSRKKGNKKISKVALIAFPIVLVLLIVLVGYLDKTGKEQAQLEKETHVVSFDLSNQPVIGSKDAKVTLVEFGDYKCGSCVNWKQHVYPQLKKDFIDTGKVNLSYSNMTFQPGNTRLAALAGEAVFAQNNDAFWKFHEALYMDQVQHLTQEFTVEYLLDIAKKAVPELDLKKLEDDIRNETYAEQLAHDDRVSKEAKVTSTPTVFINGKLHMTEQPLNYEELKAAIEKALAAS